MAWTLTELADLEKAIAQGALTVQYQDRRTTYRSLEEMLRLRGLMRKDLGLVIPGLVRDVHVITDKGLP